MASVQVLSTIRIGQLTGTNGATWPDLVDPQGWPLLNDTGPYGVLGVDLGANTKHGDRTYIFFGDVATLNMLFGGLIVVAAGLFIIWRERQLGLERTRTRKAAPPPE